MKLLLERRIYTGISTIGDLSVDGVFECNTLEDVVRPADAPKVHGATAIPSGAYNVVITFSNHFQKPLPLVQNVPNFDGIRIHPGNSDKDTEGCVLVGTAGTQPDWIGGSRDAFASLMPKIEAALRRGEAVTLVIHDNVPDPDAKPASATKKGK